MLFPRLKLRLRKVRRNLRAVVVERSNALVYLMISVILELKVEGSNPGVAVYFRVNGNGRTRATN